MIGPFDIERYPSGKGAMKVLTASLLVSLLAACTAGAGPPDGFLFGINTWSTQADPTAHVKALGATWQAPFLHWNHVQPTIELSQVELTVAQVKANPALIDAYIDACDWTRFDAQIRKLQEDGFALFPIAGQLFTGSVPKLNGKAIIPHPPDTPVSFFDNPFGHKVAPIAQEHFLGHAYLHVRAVVRRYGEITHWMVDPEINQSALFRLFGGWKAGRCWSDWGFVTAALRTLSQAVKDEQPGDQVCLALNTDQPPSVTATFGRNPLFAGAHASIMDWPEALSFWLDDTSIQADLIGIDAFESQGTKDPHCYDRLKKRIETAVERGRARPVLVASLGCPSGPEEMGWTEAYQATYVGEAVRAAVDGGATGFFYFNVWTPDRHSVAITPLDQRVVERTRRVFAGAWDKTEAAFMAELSLSMLWLGGELATAGDSRDAVTYLRSHFFPVLETAEAYWGLVRPDGTHKPSFRVLQEAIGKNGPRGAPVLRQGSQ